MAGKNKRSSKNSASEGDDTKPKRPATAYFRFVSDKRDSIRTSNPSLKPTEIVKELATMWSDLSPTEKSKYTTAYQEEWIEYSKRLKEWKKTHPDDKKESKVKKATHSKKVKKATKKKESDEENEEESEEDEREEKPEGDTEELVSEEDEDDDSSKESEEEDNAPDESD